MANICLYKILVKGPKRACYALIDIMPLYSWEKEILREEGTDKNFELVFLGDCKWSVGAYTSWDDTLGPFSPDRIEKIEDGDLWNIPIAQKALVLGCEIFCNSKDIDDSCCAVYEHYDKNGKRIHDECPKELHIKRGREYDQGYIAVNVGSPCTVSNVPACKVRFEGGTYLYNGHYTIGDVVNVDGAMRGKLGIVVETSEVNGNNSLYNVTKYMGHPDAFKSEEIEAIWLKYKPKDRKEYLVRLGLAENITKKKFLSVMEFRWIAFAIDNNNNWEAFVNTLMV